MDRRLTEQDFLSCCGSTEFAALLASAAPATLPAAVTAARDIWLNSVSVPDYLQAFAAHPQIGSTSTSISQWSKEEQSAAKATADDSTRQELAEWNARYRERFGFLFLICASGRGTPEILAELKRRYTNRPVVELEVAAQEQLKITELRLARLFGGDSGVAEVPVSQQSKPGGSTTIPRARPPISTHVLDVSRGSPAAGIEIHLEKLKGAHPSPSLSEQAFGVWVFQGSSVTNNDGRSGPLMDIVDYIDPGIYRLSFNTRKYEPSSFFPYVSVVFEVRESQKSEHFHVPLLFSPFSFTTYRGS